MSTKLSAKLILLGGEPTHWCPGCKMVHRIDVNKRNAHTGAIWTWNGNADRPTFEPSINIVGVCHYFLRDGKLQFCGDSKHQLAGQTVDLPDIPADEAEFWGAPE